jgi:septum formation protein
MALILASSSPRRRELIASLGLQVEVIKPDIDETQHPDELPLPYVQRLSREKAQAVAQKVKDEAWVLAADTVVILAADTIGIDEGGAILGKPVDADDARRMLEALRNRDHWVCTAFTVLQPVTNRLHTEVVRTRVTMRDYSDDEISAYIATDDPFDKAGSYAIQHEGFHPVAQIEGSRTNVIGLPIDEVKAALERFGVL